MCKYARVIWLVMGVIGCRGRTGIICVRGCARKPWYVHVCACSPVEIPAPVSATMCLDSLISRSRRSSLFRSTRMESSRSGKPHTPLLGYADSRSA